jgi:hypothetical protein
LYYWEGKTFEIIRTSDEYAYSYILKYENDKKKCGVDFAGNPLYLPHDVICSINYIEITNNNLPPNKEKIFKTISLVQINIFIIQMNILIIKWYMI